MHANRPEGSATLRDLIEQWGPLWAKLQREAWRDEVLDAADPAATDVGSAILDFVERVERHSGLLVERAPRRWGFPHLTFEEFYAGRSLAFEGRASQRAARIRQRLHDVRYDEPILLALGLIGRDQPEELEAMFPAAILAHGDDAAHLGLAPSKLEDLLGRDARFALRALADDLPVSPELVDTLIQRAVDELLAPRGRARFWRYRTALLDCLAMLASVPSGARLVDLLAQRAGEIVADDHDQLRRFVELARVCSSHPAVTDLLERIVATEVDDHQVLDAARVLAEQRVISPAALVRTVAIITEASDPADAIGAADALVPEYDLPTAAVDRLLATVAAGGDPAFQAAGVLRNVVLPPSAIEPLIALVATADDTDARQSAASVLQHQAHISVAAMRHLTEVISDGTDRAYLAANILEGRELPGEIAEALTEVVAVSASEAAADSVSRVLQAQDILPPVVIDRLADVIASSTDADASGSAGTVLWRRGALPPPVVERLTRLSATSQNPYTVINAGGVLMVSGRLSPAFNDRLVDIVGVEKDPWAITLAARVLQLYGHLPTSCLERLPPIIGSRDDQRLSSFAACVFDGQSAPVHVLAQLAEIVAARRMGDGTELGAVDVLRRQSPLPQVVTDRLADVAAGGSDAHAATGAAEVLAAHGDLSPACLQRLADIVACGGSSTASRVATGLLGDRRELPEAIISGLAGLVDGDASADVVENAVTVLCQHPHLPPTMMEALVRFALRPGTDGGDEAGQWYWQGTLLAKLAQASPSQLLGELLTNALTHQRTEIRQAAVEGIVILGADDTLRGRLITTLTNGIHTEAFTTQHELVDRPGHDCAYEAIWRLIEVESST